MRFALIALATLIALPSLAQDEDRIEDLIQKLGDPNYAEREQARVELIKIGRPALPALKEALKSDDMEVVVSARQIIEKIQRASAFKDIVGSETRITMQVTDGTLEDAAKILADRAGVEIRVADVFKARKVSLDLKDAELLRALDSLGRASNCRWATGNGLSFIFDDAGFVDRPSAYASVFRLSIKDIAFMLKKNFEKTDAEIDMEIDLSCEPGCDPLGYQIRLLEAVDGNGAKLDPANSVALDWSKAPGDTIVSNGAVIKVAEWKGGSKVFHGGAAPGMSLSMWDVPSDLSKLERLRCSAIITFGIGEGKELNFVGPVAGARLAIGDASVIIEDFSKDRVQIVVRGPDGERLGANVVDLDSILLEHQGRQYRPKVLMRDRSGAVITVRIPSALRGKEIAAIKLSAREIAHHRVEFTFKNVDLRYGCRRRGLRPLPGADGVFRVGVLGDDLLKGPPSRVLLALLFVLKSLAEKLAGRQLVLQGRIVVDRLELLDGPLGLLHPVKRLADLVEKPARLVGHLLG
jgi:hypothetical protein